MLSFINSFQNFLTTQLNIWYDIIYGIERKNNLIILNYNINNRIFKQVFEIKKGPSKIIEARAFLKNDKYLEITDVLKNYINPEGNICSILITPEFLSQELKIDIEKIVVVKIDNTDITFRDKEPIII